MMTQDIRDALARLNHAIDTSPPQASQLSDADARTATKAAQALADQYKASADRLRGERDELMSVLEQIANRDDAEMVAARTLHYDMRGWAAAALTRSRAARAQGEG